ncbi:MAG TPA: hypothetical protein VIP09_05025 [Dehalococcoidia bacterium]|jgi:hypothetical protein
MKQKSPSPSLLNDVVAVAGLYRGVFWMLGQQLRHGQDWQQRLQDEALRIREPQESREVAAQRHN